VRSNIDASDRDVICLQETKCESFDWRLVGTFCPKRFHSFVYSPSAGASGGILTIWNSSVFHGMRMQTKRFGLVKQFTTTENNAKWTLVCVYGPCQGGERDLFLSLGYTISIFELMTIE
jgi:exonuclease III